MTDTATVETLTAEVRCLMIGGRQVTMSVFNQLDWVEPEEINPFGRVHPARGEASEVYVVGSRHSDGALVRAYTTTWRKQVHRLAGRDDAYLAAERAKRVVMASNSDRDKAEMDRRAAWQRIAEQVLETDAGKLAARWEDLPLIVLAGLR